MSNDAAFTGNIPDFYDRGLGPLIFVDYAEEMARRAAALKPERVLETAAGTGIASQKLRDLLPPKTSITSTDLNPPMLEVAKQKFRSGEKIGFEPADATALPFNDGAFDLVVCQFGVMFYPDKDKSHREVLRVLQPGGHYLMSVWDSHAHNPFARIAHETAERFLPTDPPQFYRVPMSMHQIDPTKEALIAAGFDDITISVVPMTKAIPKAADFARALIFGNPLADQVKQRGGDPEKMVEALLEGLHREFGSDPGRMPLQAIFFSARKPA
jgi:ubiquinone/menaquinone biosynthesis C-methylase UbiE